MRILGGQRKPRMDAHPAALISPSSILSGNLRYTDARMASDLPRGMQLVGGVPESGVFKKNVREPPIAALIGGRGRWAGIAQWLSALPLQPIRILPVFGGKSRWRRSPLGGLPLLRLSRMPQSNHFRRLGLLSGEVIAAARRKFVRLTTLRHPWRTT